jgi:predicted DNA-binding protein (MmcQ/YjbR family)
MNVESFRTYCLKKKGVTEEFPFGETTLVYKVMGKMFALADLDAFESMNLKCDPERGAELREQYPSITPGYHMNKKHWITVPTDGSLPDKFILGLVDDSYALVAHSLTRSQKLELGTL